MAIKYGYHDKPPIHLSLLLGFQHLLASFNGIILVPLIVVGTLTSDYETKIFCINSSILMAGLATIVQAQRIWKIGARMPCVKGGIRADGVFSVFGGLFNSGTNTSFS
jgi:NCS2 family nucleobase:cation symporter-2